MATKSTTATRVRADEQINSLPNWTNEFIHTADDVIDAYFKGKEEGSKNAMSDYKRVLVSQFEENIKRATSIAENVKDLINKKFDTKGLHLKFENITTFKALYIVTEDDFVNDKFRDAYTIAKEFQHKNEDSNFSINFSFTPQSEHFDEHCLAADGYMMRYEKK